VQTFFEQGGRKGSQMHTFALLDAKNSDFLKFMVCPHGQGGRGSIFLDFEQTTFMNSLLFL